MDVLLRERWSGSRRAWARAASVGDTTLGRILSGETEAPQLNILTDLAAACDLSVAQLIGEAPLVPEPPQALPADQDLTRIAAELRRKAAGHSAAVEELLGDLSSLIRGLQARE